MKSECWGGGFLTTEYTEAGEIYLKITERSLVYSVWERSDLSVKFCGKNEVGGGIKRPRNKRIRGPRLT